MTLNVTAIRRPDDRAAAETASGGMATMRFESVAGDGMPCRAALSEDVVLLSREVAGMECRIRLGATHFRGVAVVERDGTSTVRLLHPDLALSLDLDTPASADDAEALADEVADLMGLPRVLMGGTGRFWMPADEDPLGAAPEERRFTLAGPRRARFLTRRCTGSPVSLRRIHGEEIVARS